MCVFCIDKVNEILLAHYYVLKGSNEEDCVLVCLPIWVFGQGQENKGMQY